MQKTSKRRKRYKKRKKKNTFFRMLVLVGFIFVVFYFVQNIAPQMNLSAESKISRFAEKNGCLREDYPDRVVSLLENNPDAEEFVLNYPLKKGQQPQVDMEAYRDCTTVPLFLQWDMQWGYMIYGGDVLGLTGCGPTCLSMVSVYLQKDLSRHPAWMAQFSIEQGYCVEGQGTSWSLMSEGAEKLGLKVTEIPLNEKRIIANLKAGNPIICVVGPGDFTSEGHFIVLWGYEDGNILLNDPNSRKRSEKRWTYEELESQIRGIWVYTI